MDYVLANSMEIDHFLDSDVGFRFDQPTVTHLVWMEKSGG